MPQQPAFTGNVLDDSGNVIGKATGQILDEQGNPISMGAPTKPATPAKLSFGDEILGGIGQVLGAPAPMAADVVKGLIKSALGTIQGGGELIRQIPGVGKALSVADVTLPKPINLQPSNPVQAGAKMAGDVAQFFLPAADIEKAVTAIPAAAKATRALARAALEGASAAGISSAQQGTTEGAGTVGGVTAGLALAVPPVVRGVSKVLGSPLVKQGGEKLIADVLTPAGRSKEIRALGKEAASVAPRLAKEQGLGVWSRQAAQAKVGDKLDDLYAKLDEAHAKYAPDELIDTEMIVGDLERKRAALGAEAASGEGAHAQLEKMGLTGTAAAAPESFTKFKDLPVAYKAEMRRMLSEMENFQYIEPQQEFVASRPGQVTARKGGPAAAGRARFEEIESTADRSFEAGTAGAPVFDDILAGRSGTRGQVESALRKYIEEGVPPSSLIKRALDVADARIRDPRTVSRAMLPPGAGTTAADLEGKIGFDVMPGPQAARAGIIQQAINEIRQLGPGATYGALQKIRQAYDIPAMPLYRKMIGADPQAVTRAMLESKGAADVTGSIREVMALTRPETAPLNKEVHFWKKVDNLFDQVEEMERVRPRIGRAMLAAATGGAVGGAMGHAISGMVLGPIIETVLSSGPTTKLVAGRYLTTLEAAMKSGSQARIIKALQQLRRLAVSLGASGRSAPAPAVEGQ